MPLIILALLSIGLGWKFFGLNDFLNAHWKNLKAATPTAHAAALIGGSIASLTGLGLGWLIYRRAKEDPLPAKLGRFAHGMRGKFYFDELYVWLNRWTQEKLSHMADWFDRWIVAGTGIKGTSGAVDLAGCLMRLFQSGNLQTYTLLLAIGLLLMLGLFLF